MKDIEIQIIGLENEVAIINRMIERIKKDKTVLTGAATIIDNSAERIKEIAASVMKIDLNS